MDVTESPCRRICVMDQQASLCLGCGRSLAEISRWAVMTPEQRRRVMADLPARLEALAPAPIPARRGGRRRTTPMP